MVEIDASGMDTADINLKLHDLSSTQESIIIRHPEARHNFAVGLHGSQHIIIDGSVGYFCGGLCDGPTIEVKGNAAWGMADNLMSGTVVVRQNAGSVAGIGMRGGTGVVYGNAGSRSGQAMKKGTLLIAGDAGFMTGYFMIGGRIVILGGAAEGLGECMIRGEIFVAGPIASLGQDAIETEISDRDRQWLSGLLDRWQLGATTFRKVVSAEGLHHYETYEGKERPK